VIRRRSRKWKSQRDINGAAERRDLYRRHADIVVGRDHRIELAAHRAHEHRVGRERPVDSRGACCRRENFRIFAPESAAIARMRIQRAERDPRLRDSEPAAQTLARQSGRSSYRFRGQLLDHVVERNMSRRQHHAELVRREHHRDARAREVPQHLGVSGIVVATGV